MMINDGDNIDQVNPFVDEPPGTWSRPYEFGSSDKEDVEKPMWETDDKSPACATSSTAGDNQVSWCEPGVPNCPMSRALEPTQRIDPDITYPEDPGNVIKPVVTAPKSTNWFMIFVLLVLIAMGITIIVKF